MESLSYDITPQEIPVTIGGESYVLREATGGAHVQYQNMMQRSAQYGEGGLKKIENMADADPFLLSLCLFDAKNVLVPVAKIRSWPSRVVDDLVTHLKKMSGIGQDATMEDLVKQRKEIDEKIAKLKGDELGNSPEDSQAGAN